MSAVAMKKLHNDKRGAVMLTGLCMSCFLIGCLWFLIGIGDAIVFRDTMQEATDHATFTSAVLHAKGMNFISACNLIMLALITVHIIMGLIHDILLAICIISLGFGCGAYLSWRRVYTTYGKIFKPIAGAIHYAEVVASYGYPLLSAYKGYTMGNDYGAFGPKKHDVKMIVVSPSLLPGGLMDGALNKLFTRKGKGPAGADGAPTDDGRFTTDTRKSKKGLPVMAKKFSDVCDKVANIGLDALFGQTGFGGGKAMNMVRGWIGGILKARYCNDMGSSTPDIAGRLSEGNAAIDSANTKIDADNANVPAGGKMQDKIGNIDIGTGGGGSSCMKDNSSIDPGLDKWWGCDGPLVPWSGTENGSAWNQVWGVNFRPSYTDDQQHAVAIGYRKRGQQSTAEPSTYFASAEFYFDCSKDWTDGECNRQDNAGYSVQWRARLKRLEFPQIGELLVSFGGQFLSNMKAYKDFVQKIKDLPKATGPDGKPLPSDNPLTSGGFEGVIDNLFKKYVTQPLQSGSRGLGKYMNPNLGAYH